MSSYVGKKIRNILKISRHTTMNAKVKKNIAKFYSQINYTNKLTQLKGQMYFIQIS